MKMIAMVCVLVVLMTVTYVPTSNAMLGTGICDVAEYYGWDNPAYNRWCMYSLMEDPGWPDGYGPDGTWW